MTNTVKVNRKNNTITVSKTFLKKAEIYGTNEYKKMSEILADPALKNFSIISRTIKKNPEKESYRNLTYKNMETYISTLNLSTIYMAEYEVAKQRSKIQKSPYKYMVKWFVESFPNYKEAEIFSEAEASTLSSAKTQENVTAMAA